MFLCRFKCEETVSSYGRMGDWESPRVGPNVVTVRKMTARELGCFFERTRFSVYKNEAVSA